MLHYTHLSPKERDTIYMMKLHGFSKISIARALNRNRSTIGREIERNAIQNWYSPIRAQDVARQKRKDSYKGKLDKDTRLCDYVINNLKNGWSPQTISGRLRYEQNTAYICPEAIYQFIYSKEGQRRELYKNLIRKHSKRKIKCGRKPNKQTIKNMVPISQRPEHINQRTKIGDFEMDLVFFKGNMSANIVTMVERKSRFMLLAKAHSKRSATVTKAILNKLASLPKQALNSATFDRGTEFAQHTDLHSIFGMQTFFCNPHSPWQKGQIENANGRLRRFLSYATSVKKLLPSHLQAIQDRMNNQPRKCLGYRTPTEVFFEELSQTNGGYCCG